jgi:hypothetical protein
MVVDPRFPNRKNKDWEHPLFDTEPAESELKETGVEETETIATPSTYRVIAPKAKTAEELRAEEALLYPFRAETGLVAPQTTSTQSAVPPVPIVAAAYPEAIAPAPADAGGMIPPQAGKTPVATAPLPPKATLTRKHLLIALGCGIVFAVVIALISWLGGSSDNSHDFGTVDSNAVGLRGQLVTKWDKKLEYHLTIEPSDPAYVKGFGAAVDKSPQPLSVEIHLQDAQGFVLCSKPILLKYDVRNSPDFAAANPDMEAEKSVQDGTQAAPLTQAKNDLLEAQEAERELGKDVFQNQLGPDGRAVALKAQGDFNCPVSAYRNAASWSFTPNFPSLAEQDTLLNGKRESAAESARQNAEKLAARKKKDMNPPVKLLPFSLEGDDSVVEFDAYRGVMQTVAGVTFFFDKTGGAVYDPKWQDYPVAIHYKCDRSSECLVMHHGSGALRARMKR